MIVIGYDFCFNCLFRFLKILRKLTRFDLGLDCAKDGAPHSESFATSRTPSNTKCSTSFLNIYSCTFVNVYVIDNIFFASSLNQSLLDLFSRCQVFHLTTLLIYVIILAIHYVVLLSAVDIEFP